MKILTCTCCGAEITAPQFFNGKPYGWTCIKKVAPAQKQSKVKFVPVELVEVVRTRKIVTTEASGPVASMEALMKLVHDGETKLVLVRDSQKVEQGGVLFVSENVFK